MRRSPLLALLPFLALAAALPARTEPDAATETAPPVTGRLSEVGGTPVLELWGTPRERGFAHGWLLAAEVVRGLDQGIRGFLGERLPIYDGLLKNTAKVAFRLSPAEQEEMEGLLAGLEARLPAEADRQVACLGRAIALDDLRALNAFGDLYALGCSSLAAWGPRTADGKALVVRNFDFPALDLVLALQHVRVVAPRTGDDPALGWVGVSHPGSIGAMTVLNEEGVFAAIHDVDVPPSLADVAQGNVPRLVAIRRLAERLHAAGAVEKARDLCREWNTLHGNNFMVATPEPGEGLAAGVLEYDTREADDRGVDLRGAEPAGEAPSPFVACTNHHRVRGAGTCRRYDALTKALATDPSDVLTVDEMFGIGSLAAFPGPGEAIARFGTLHQVVAETGKAVLHVRFAKEGGNIRDAKETALDVKVLLGALPKP